MKDDRVDRRFDERGVRATGRLERLGCPQPPHGRFEYRAKLFHITGHFL